MLIYYGIIILVAASLFCLLHKDRRLDIMIFMFGVVVTGLVSGLRMDCDADYLGYIEMFEDTPTLAHFDLGSIETLYGENGYLLLNSVVKTVGAPFYVLVFVSAITAVGLKSLVIYKLSPYRALAFALFCCFHFITIEFIQMRWAVACGFVILGVYCIYVQRPIWALLWIAVGTAFHYYSVIFLILFLPMVLRRERLYYVILVASYLLALVFRSNVLGYFMVDESETYAVKRYTRYVADPTSIIGVFSYIKISIFPALYVAARLFNPEVCRRDPLIDFLFKTSFLAISATLLVSSVPIFHYRAVVVADILSILLVLKLLEKVFNEHLRIIIAILLSFGLSWWYVLDIRNYRDAGRLSEYNTCLKLLF